MVMPEPGHLELREFELQKTPPDHILVNRSFRDKPMKLL